MTDHRALMHLGNQGNLSPRQSRWVAALQIFDIRTDYIPGPSNYLADYLSRLPMYQPLCVKCNDPVEHQIRQNVEDVAGPPLKNMEDTNDREESGISSIASSNPDPESGRDDTSDEEDEDYLHESKATMAKEWSEVTELEA